MIAAADAKPGNTNSPDPANLPKEIFYIGMSSHVDGRLEKHHKAVAQYKMNAGPGGHQKLWFSTWDAAWTNSWPRTSPKSIVEAATLAFAERGLILAYALKHGCRPAMNRE
jgi:hypothetical protein